jgi:hypothetical protein
VLPGTFAIEIDDAWLEHQSAVIDEAKANITDMPLMGTIALSGEAARSQDQIGLLLERAESWRLPAYYLVCEHPKGQYLVDDAIWVANVLDIAIGLRLLGLLFSWAIAITRCSSGHSPVWTQSLRARG